jgi:hypothetical protein
MPLADFSRDFHRSAHAGYLDQTNLIQVTVTQINTLAYGLS